MSKLRASILEILRVIGNNSGCHQLPERSFFYHGKQFPICARCTGVVIGQLIAIGIGFFTNVNFRLSLLSLGVMGLDWGMQEIKIKRSTNTRRLITGILGGFGLFSIYVSVIKRLIINTSRPHCLYFGVKIM